MVKQRYRRISIAVRNQMTKFIQIVDIRLVEWMCFCVWSKNRNEYKSTKFTVKSYTSIVLASHAYFKHTRTKSNDHIWNQCNIYICHTKKKNKCSHTNRKKNCDKFNEFQRSVFFRVVVFFFSSCLFGVVFWRIPYIHICKHKIQCGITAYSLAVTVGRATRARSKLPLTFLIYGIFEKNVFRTRFTLYLVREFYHISSIPNPF